MRSWENFEERESTQRNRQRTKVRNENVIKFIHSLAVEHGFSMKPEIKC